MYKNGQRDEQETTEKQCKSYEWSEKGPNPIFRIDSSTR